MEAAANNSKSADYLTRKIANDRYETLRQSVYVLDEYVHQLDGNIAVPTAGSATTSTKSYARRRFTAALDRFKACASPAEKDKVIWWLTGWSRAHNSCHKTPPALGTPPQLRSH